MPSGGRAPGFPLVTSTCDGANAHAECGQIRGPLPTFSRSRSQQAEPSLCARASTGARPAAPGTGVDAGGPWERRLGVRPGRAVPGCAGDGAGQRGPLCPCPLEHVNRPPSLGGDMGSTLPPTLTPWGCFMTKWLTERGTQ